MSSDWELIRSRSWNGYLTGGHIDKVSCKSAIKNMDEKRNHQLLHMALPGNRLPKITCSYISPSLDCHKNGHSGCIPDSQTQDNSVFFSLFFLESWNPWPQGSMLCKRASSTTPVAMAVAMD